MDSSSGLSFSVGRWGDGGVEIDLGVNIGEFVADRSDFGSSRPLLDSGPTDERVEGWRNGEGGGGDVRSMTTPFSKVVSSVSTMPRSRGGLLLALLFRRSLSRPDSSSESTKLLDACTCSQDTPETPRERAGLLIRAWFKERDEGDDECRRECGWDFGEEGGDVVRRPE